MKQFFFFLFITFFSCNTFSQISVEDFSYSYNGTTYIGKVARNPERLEPMPLVIIVHEWWGLNGFAVNRSIQTAELGYIAFAVDMYGGGKVAASAQEAGKLAGELKNNPSEIRARIQAAIDAIKGKEFILKDKIAVSGYCFGGTSSLEVARGGVDIKGVISFHGGLSTPNPKDTKTIKARVLVLHGKDDKLISEEEIANFEKEMNSSGAVWEMTSYSNAVHGFTNPNNGTDVTKPVAFNAVAERRSWEAYKSFLAEIFD